MTDTIKEIYNGTLTYGDYSGGLQTIVATDASTTLVIKDIEINTNTYTAGNYPTLQINSFPIATLSKNLTGSEIVGTSQNVYLKNNNTLNYANIAINYWPATNATSFYSATSPTTVFSPTSSISVTQGASTTATTLTNNTQVVLSVISNGNYYYYTFDNNSTTNLYKRTGGVNGTETTLMSTSYTPVTWDGVNKFYYVKNASPYNLYSYNTATNTETALISFGTPASTYPFIAYCNGLIFYQSTYNGVSLKIYNIATNTIITTSISLTYSSNATKPVIFYDATNYIYKIITTGSVSFTSTYSYTNIQSNSNNSSFSKIDDGTITTSSYNIQPASTNGQTILSFGSATNTNTVYVLDKTLSTLSSFQVSGATFGNYTAGQAIYSTPTTSDLNTYGPQIQLRITGVQSN